MSIVQVTERPTEGQFVEMWVYQGRLYSTTLRWVDDVLLEYTDYHDDWVPYSIPSRDAHSFQWHVLR